MEIYLSKIILEEMKENYLNEDKFQKKLINYSTYKKEENVFADIYFS